MAQLPPPVQPVQPPVQPPVVVVYQPTNGLALFSGLAGIFSWFICPFLGALVAIITGHIALGELRRAPQPGRGWAIAGLVLGYAHLVIYGLIVLLILTGTFAILGLLSLQPSPTP